jgi:hypothetical protein
MSGRFSCSRFSQRPRRRTPGEAATEPSGRAARTPSRREPARTGIDPHPVTNPMLSSFARALDALPSGSDLHPVTSPMFSRIDGVGCPSTVSVQRKDRPPQTGLLALTLSPEIPRHRGLESYPFLPLRSPDKPGFLCDGHHIVHHRMLRRPLQGVLERPAESRVTRPGSEPLGTR